MRRLTSTVAAVACGAVLVGCGGNPDAAPAPTPSPSPTASSPTASETPDPPPPPKTRDAKTREGAIATVRWFLRSMDYAGQTGDASFFRRTFQGTCTKCEAIAIGIEQTYAKGGSIRGGAWVPVDFRYYGISGGIGTIDAVVNYEAQDFTPSSSTATKTFPARSNVLKAFQLRWDGNWTVGALDPEL